ncbi:MAG: phosphoribosylanthranilate isomerase [Selenomonadaceae bacterium]|nr:phosphoribosylanthranilate isomerase [Selenomonadaceae bacterium]
MTKIKFCGLTRAEDIFAVNEILPEFVGFVFYEESRRYIAQKNFLELKKNLSEKISSVGVFVDEKISIVAEIAKNLDFIQLHGSEDENYISALKNFTDKKIIKAFKIKTADDLKIAENFLSDFVLLDGGAGDGKTFDWRILKNFERKYFLAGGLNCENISDAIKILKPFAVDVSSGIETNNLKDAEKMKNFARIVRRR